jgi:hypothetical protein
MFSDLERAEYCEQKLTDPTWKQVRARICHIRGLLPTSARHDSSLTGQELNRYENLLLLCPNHHALIDDLEPDRYTVELLEAMKARAEQHGGSTEWADEHDMDTMARSAIGLMRQVWWGRRYLPIVRATQIRAGSIIDYEGEPVEISKVVKRPDGHSVHLDFSQPLQVQAGTIVGWDLDDEDPLNVHTL